jgi:hypothetical protein
VSGTGLDWLPNRVVVVVDTNAILESVANDCLHGPHWRSLLHQGADLGTSHLHASDHVYDELYEPDKFQRLADWCGIRAAELQDHFEAHYLERLRFVSIPERHPLEQDPRVAAITDPDDVPTGILATLLAPCVVFTSDRAFIRAGLAPKQWLPTARATVAAGEADAGLRSIGMLVVVPTVGVGAGIQRIGAYFEVPGWLLVFGVAAAGAWYLWDGERRQRVRELVQPYAEKVLEMMANLVEEREAALSVIRNAALSAPGAPTLEQLLARRLATCPEPQLGTDLFRSVRTSCEVQQLEVFGLLNASPLFIKDGDRWQFGRSLSPPNSQSDESIAMKPLGPRP